MPLVYVPPVTLSLIECLCVLRYMRKVRDDLRRDLRELEERIKSGVDGVHQTTAMALDAEIAIVEEAIRKLWEAYNATAPPPPQSVP